MVRIDFGNSFDTARKTNPRTNATAAMSIHSQLRSPSTWSIGQLIEAVFASARRTVRSVTGRQEATFVFELAEGTPTAWAFAAWSSVDASAAVWIGAIHHLQPLGARRQPSFSQLAFSQPALLDGHSCCVLLHLVWKRRQVTVFMQGFSCAVLECQHVRA